MIAFVRTSRTRSPSINLLKTLLQTAVFWGLFLVVLPSWIVAWETCFGAPSFKSSALTLAGAAGLVVASCLGLWSGATMAVRGRGTPLPFDTAAELVVEGPYRYIRNPMATAGLAQGACVAAIHGSCAILTYVACGFIAWNWGVRVLEEDELAARFGKEYEHYRAQVRCWIPGRGYDEPPTQ